MQEIFQNLKNYFLTEYSTVLMKTMSSWKVAPSTPPNVNLNWQNTHQKVFVKCPPEVHEKLFGKLCEKNFEVKNNIPEKYL